MREPLSTRNEHQTRELTTRNFQLRASTANEEERSVESVISTDTPVEVWDWRRGETIDEILLAPAAQLPAQMPMLANHDRWSLDSVLGSIRNLRVEGGNSIVGRMFFAREDEDAEKAWNKVRQGHIVDVSVGYRVNESVEIQSGQTAVVAGRSFTAGKRALRVVTNWTPKEGSLVPIGADKAAKIRDDKTSQLSQQTHFYKGDSRMNPKLRAFLETLGLRHEADETEAQTYYNQLPAEDKARADASVQEQVPANPPAAPVQNRSEQTPVDQADIARQAVNAERERVRSLRTLAGQDVPAETLQRAIDEGWDESRASREFLTAVRTARPAGVGPAIHSRGREQDTNARSLAAGMLISQGMDPTRHVFRGGIDSNRNDRLSEQDADRGHRFRSMSSFDLMRECTLLDGGRWCHSPEELFEHLRSAPSGATLSYVFSTNVYARLIQGWETVGDTTTGWCEEEDVPNFLQQEDISLAANARLQRLARGDTAKDATMSDAHETYKIARYAKKFSVAEEDIIDDRLGAIMRMPMEMGEAARQMRPDLVYSLMLENPSLVADSGALFNATAVTTAGGHANLGTGALSSSALKAAISAMVKQRLNRTTKDPGRSLMIRPRFLIVPAALEWLARELTAAAALAKLFADTSDPFYAQLNLLAQEGLRVVVDDRVGAIGVMDPKSEAARTGSETNWFLTTGRGLRVAYRRGTNRQPLMRSYTLDRGQWGMGWDINLDIGASFLEYRTWYKSTGTVS